MKNRTNIRWLTQLALLVAILLVLNYTPLGYLQIGPLSASLLTVPVAIGAMTMGPAAGAILGGVFGATSFIQALEGKSAMGSALFQVSPFGTFVVCFVARVLVGLCAGLIGIGATLLILIPGNALIHHIADTNDVNAFLPVVPAVILILLSVILTLLGGLIPSRKAAKSDPVTALRTE